MTPDALRALAMAAVLATLSGTAAGGTPPTDIPWPHPGEALRYHSCGCGDACWVADVVVLKTRAVQARLRCDCETLHFSAKPGQPSEDEDLGRCEAINDSPGKLDAIRDKLEALRPAR